MTSPLNIRQHRDASSKDYKQAFHVANDTNYCMAIYEGLIKNKVKQDFELVKSIEAATYFKGSTCRTDYPTLVPDKSNRELPLKAILRIGTMVLLYEETPTEIDFSDKKDLARRLYKVTGLSYLATKSGDYGRITLKYHQEARQSKDIKSENIAFKMREEPRPAIMLLHTQFRALVEDIDFHINALGEIELING